MGTSDAPTAGPSRAAIALSPRAAVSAARDTEGRDGLLSGDEGVDDDGYEGEYTDAEDTEDYETLRLRRIKENQMLLDELGIHPSLAASASTSSLAVTAAPRPRKQRPIRPPVYDRSGYLVSQPGPGQTFRMACVEMPSDRKIRKKISDGDYEDCSHWAAGEVRRWRFGDGEGAYEQGEEVLIGGVGPDFRWRKWRGIQNELRREMRLRGELNEVDMRVTRSTAAEEGVSEYSLIPGNACHQCRRKSEKLKMKCRNTVKECNAVFCETCCKRYSYFDFDPDSRSFICPLCRDVCNCSNCMRKRDLAHLLDTDGLKRAKSLRFTLRKEGKSELTVQEWLEEAASQTLRAPFDRVRIINAHEDVISPELPPEEPEPVIAATKTKRIKKSKATEGRAGGPKGVKKPKESLDNGMRGTTSPAKIVLKFTAPTAPSKSASPKKAKPHQIRPKEVDSDGDTVNGWSGDEQEPIASGSGSRSGSRGRTSTITPLSSREPTPQPRLAFPPRPSQSTMPGFTSFSADGFIHPAMMNQSLPVPPLFMTEQLPSHAKSPFPGDIPPDLIASPDVSRKRKRSLDVSDTISSSNFLSTEKAASKFIPHLPSSPDPIAGPFEPDGPSSSDSFGRQNDYNIKDIISSNFINGTNGSAMLSADPPPYSHSPPRKRKESDSPGRMDSFLPPAPMAYSLAQHLQVRSHSPQDGTGPGHAHTPT